MPWLRWYDDVLDDKKLARIARDTGLTYTTVTGAWGLLLALANTSPVRGRLLLSDSEELSIEDVAETFHATLQETKALLQGFRKYRMIGSDGQPGDYITNWDKRQFESDSSTERVRKHREMKRAGNVSVTPPDQSTDQSTETEGSRACAPGPSPLPLAVATYLDSLGIRETTSPAKLPRLYSITVGWADSIPDYSDTHAALVISHWCRTQLDGYRAREGKGKAPGLQYFESMIRDYCSTGRLPGERVGGNGHDDTKPTLSTREPWEQEMLARAERKRKQRESQCQE